MNIYDENRIRIYTISFIYILFISMSIYPSTPGWVRPPDLLIPFLFIVALSQLDKIKNIILIGVLLIMYLFAVDIINNGVTGDLVIRGRTWMYAILFIAMAKIFASIDFYKYEKSIMHAIYLSLGILIVIYISLYFRVPFMMEHFANYNEQAWALGRIGGVFIYVLLSFLVISYIKQINHKLNYIVLTSMIFLYIFMQSRTTLFTFLVLYIVLFFSKKALFFLTITGISTYSFIIVALENLMKTEYRFIAGRLAEMIYFWNSPAMFVRMNDTKTFVENWLSDWTSFFIGHGLSFQLTFPRFDYEYEPLTGELVILKNVYRTFTMHRADSLVTELIVDGGLFLLVFIAYIYIYAFIKIYKNDKRLGIAFLLMFIMYALSTVHLITNFALVFLMASMYYGSISLKNRKENNL